MTFLFSPSAAAIYGTLTGRNKRGKTFSYTCMHDEVEYGDWAKSYHWPDARVVSPPEDESDCVASNLNLSRELQGQLSSWRHDPCVPTPSSHA